MSRFFLLIGDAFLRERQFKQLCAGAGSGQLETHLFFAADFDAEKFLVEASTYPFLSETKILRVKDAQDLSKSEKALLIKSFGLAEPAGWVVFEAEDISEKDPLYQWSAEKGKIFLLTATEQEKTAFIKEGLQAKAKKIERDALELLLERSGSNFSLLAEALEKLLLVETEDGIIGSDDVMRLATAAQTYNAFDLVNAFCRRDRVLALKIFAYLFDDMKVPVQELMGTLNWFFKQAWKALALFSKGASNWDVKKELRVRSENMDDLARYCRRHKKQSLKDIFEALFYLDWNIKQGRVEPRAGLEYFLIKYI